MHVGLHVKYPLLLSDFNETCIFSTDFRQIFKYQISQKSDRLEPSCSMRTEGQTDMTKLIIAICNFANAPINNTQRYYEFTQSAVRKIPVAIKAMRQYLLQLTFVVRFFSSPQFLL